MHCVKIHAKVDKFPDFHGIANEFKIILQEVISLVLLKRSGLPIM